MKRLWQTRSRLLTALMALAVLFSGAATATAQGIGNVQLVRIWATGTPNQESSRDLFVDDKVFGKEVVETVRDGALHLLFADETEFRLGSDSRATLDKFIYDPASKAGEFTVSLKEGLFRLKTGRIKKEGIRVITPVAVIQVQGTVLTIEVLRDGTVRAYVSEGKAVLTSNRDGSQVLLVPGGDSGQVAPGGSAEPYRGPFSAIDSGILPGALFETETTITTANAGLDEGLTDVVFESATSGQSLSAISPLAIFTSETQSALDTVIRGDTSITAAAPTASAALAPTAVAQLAPALITDASTVQRVIDSVSRAVIDTQLAVGVTSAGGLANGNGGFESGTFAGFVPSGEAAIIASLGPITPPNGQFMAIFSTGGAAVNGTASSIATEPFALPAGATSISLEFNFLSNEFPDFINRGFNDTLTATINNTQQSILETVDTATFLDATGTGFNGQTGFQTADIDVSNFVGAGDLTVEIQIIDAGDAVFDSAVLVDSLDVN